MIDFIREFKFGRPQQIAALLLTAFIAQGFWAARRSFDYNEATICHWGQQVMQGKPPDRRLYNVDLGFLSLCAVPSIILDQKPLLFAADMAIGFRNVPSRLPSLLFGTWLAGALWWVTRRLFNDEGGFVALALLCFSVPMILASSYVSSDIVTAWSLYGMVYTSIGVAHTLYAPPRKWVPRILLLGLAFGFTAVSNLMAFFICLILAAGFMLYLAPGRRIASLAILSIASGIAAGMAALSGAPWYIFSHSLIFPRSVEEGGMLQPGHLPQLDRGWQGTALLFVLCIAFTLFIFWRRCRYFGNFVPLLTAGMFLFSSVRGYNVWIWALPFLFTFIGGIAADLLETRWKVPIAWTIAGSLACYAALSLEMVTAIR